ncbi:acyl-ACP thioesterase domain-containing protein [Lactococcus nasutitermitis]|uniref:Acyl-ACP thioesterase domain-containing protein n=1 Tax=Lactococcus nasutitermitis TaxID=1652957 RepID=A0ABV9JCS8_9LACT|nr:acyl-[acyl-carrier-protein] thioesterase [Lactococcus nasutitermitis]
MSLKYSEKYQVPFYESDAFKNMKISSLLAVALQISGVQSTKLDRSDVWVAEHYHLFWAVIEYELEITRLPKFSETITIETEATSYNKFFCYRNFWFKDAAGNVLVEIKSTWVLMDKESRKVERVLDEIVAPYQSEKTSRILRSHKFAKKDTFENAELMSYPVRFSDLDMNGHVNNAKYYDWASDMIDFDFRKNHQPKKVYIKYNHEVLYGSQIDAKMLLTELSSQHNINDDSAQVEIVWEKI